MLCRNFWFREDGGNRRVSGSGQRNESFLAFRNRMRWRRIGHREEPEYFYFLRVNGVNVGKGVKTGTEKAYHNKNEKTGVM